MIKERETKKCTIFHLNNITIFPKPKEWNEKSSTAALEEPNYTKLQQNYKEAHWNKMPNIQNKDIILKPAIQNIRSHLGINQSRSQKISHPYPQSYEVLE